ncbi:hypothetical protein AB4Y45_34160 [Paraburkholderia sp. EG287A]|uniref:hypothetical protein n=1 Tax=Paraburkholderia sp. EG287A TaxID=3237012 RepID=UPI0034D2398A
MSAQLAMNKPTIRVLTQYDAMRRAPVIGEVCISITNPRQPEADLEPGWSDVLRLGFHDTDRKGGGFTPMSLDHAREVLQFARTHRDVPMTVHCWAGSSRSVGVAVFLAAWLDRELLPVNDVLAPNPWVVRKLQRAALGCAMRWRDFDLMRVALAGPLTRKYRYRMVTKAIADTYVK